MLFTAQEINAVLALIARLPMSPAEAQFAMAFFQRLKNFCTPPKPDPETDNLDEADKHFSGPGPE